MTDKGNLLAKENELSYIFNEVKEKFIDASFLINKNLVSLKIESENPDPVEISIEIRDSYRVTYWDGYAVNEFYDYENLNKAVKKFKRFTKKAMQNIEKFGIK